jgi:hypothetical protein
MSSFAEPLAQDLLRALQTIETRPGSIAAADTAQQALLEILSAHQHQGAAFLTVYHGITVAVSQALAAGRLGPRCFFERLAGKFAERHFDGVKAALGLDTTSDAARFQLWEPSFAFDAAGSGDTSLLQAPVAHFLVGMSCHINLDLAVALEETIRELGLQDDAATIDEIERGHDLVNDILAAEVEASLTVLAQQMACPLSQLILDLDAVAVAREVAMLIIRQWRAKTFADARRLLAAGSDDEREALRREIYRSGLGVTLALLVALPRLIGLILTPAARGLLTTIAAVWRAARRQRARWGVAG